MKMFNDLGALVLWGLTLLMAFTLNLPVVWAEEEKPTREGFKAFSDEDLKETFEKNLSEPSIKFLGEHLNKIRSMTPEERDQFGIDYFELYLNCEFDNTISMRSGTATT